MNLRSACTFWPIKNGVIRTFPTLEKNIECDVVVLGGGITGALVAESLTRAGVNTVVVDKRKIAHGSTSTSTALLQYEIDEPLHTLQEKIGVPDATTAYRLCADSIGYIENIIKDLSDDCAFRKCSSLYFSKNRNDAEDLYDEFVARKKAGFDVQWLDKNDVQQHYNFVADCAIRSELAAQVDPYRLTYALLELVEKRGGRVFEETNVIDVQTANSVVLTSAEGLTIRAKKIVFAVGYEAKNFLKEKTADLKSTYACISTPLAEKFLWPERSLLWNTDEPYFYGRTTDENRILIGGEDIQYEDDEIRDALISEKKKKLEQYFKKLFPHIPLGIEYSWAGTFGETKDALPYIDESPEWKNAYFALGYGGNGITFSAVAAQAITQMYLGKNPEYLKIFRFGR